MAMTPPKPGQPGYENPKFLRPGTGKPVPVPNKPAPTNKPSVGKPGPVAKPAISFQLDQLRRAVDSAKKAQSAGPISRQQQIEQQLKEAAKRQQEAVKKAQAGK